MSGLSRRQMEITNAFGLHLRAASQPVQRSQQFQPRFGSSVTVVRPLAGASLT